jgi:hypothetical protein
MFVYPLCIHIEKCIYGLIFLLSFFFFVEFFFIVIYESSYVEDRMNISITVEYSKQNNRYIGAYSFVYLLFVPKF